MNNKTVMLAILNAIILMACSTIGSWISRVSRLPETQTPFIAAAQPALNLTVENSTPSFRPDDPVIYYYFLDPEDTPPPGSVVILKDILLLGPQRSRITRVSDPAVNIKAALQGVFFEPRNEWESSALNSTEVTVDGSRATVKIEGKYFAPGDIVLIAARQQILLSIFAEHAVQSALVTINGKNIANLGISRESEALPDDYSYTRAEIENYLSEHAR